MKLLLLLILFLLSSLPITAKDNPLGITFYGSFLHTEKVPDALFFFSKIQRNDSFELRKALRNHDIDKLILSSRGGSVFEGLQMAGIIHDKGLTTYVPKIGLDGSGNCASACSFMFFGGDTKVIGGKVGVHQFYSDETDTTAKVSKVEKEALFTVSEIIGFLNEFKTPPFVFEKMFQQSEMYYFNEREAKRLEKNPEELINNEIKKIELFIVDFIKVLNAEKENETILADKSTKEIKVTKDNSCSASTPKNCDDNILCNFASLTDYSVSTHKRWKESSFAQVAVVEAKRRGLSCGTSSKNVTKKTILDVQYQLNRLGCEAGKPDGVIGSKTFSALKKWKAVGGSYSQGIINIDLLNKLKFSSLKCKKNNINNQTKTTSNNLKTKKELTCWNRNINAAVASFTSRSAAESWFPNYVYITDKMVQFGRDADYWYEPEDNDGENYLNAKSFYQGKVFKFKYGKKYNRLTVTMGTEGGYKPIPPVIYMKCEHK